jgi:hypothetical protein
MTTTTTDTTIYHLNLSGTRTSHLLEALSGAEILAEGPNPRAGRGYRAWMLRSAEGTAWLLVGPRVGDPNRSDRLASEWTAMKTTDTPDNRALIQNASEWD